MGAYKQTGMLKLTHSYLDSVSQTKVIRWIKWPVAKYKQQPAK